MQPGAEPAEREEAGVKRLWCLRDARRGDHDKPQDPVRVARREGRRDGAAHGIPHQRQVILQTLILQQLVQLFDEEFRILPAGHRVGKPRP